MRWSFPILSRFIPGLAPKAPVDPDEGVPRPAFPPQIHPNDPAYDYDMHGTYSNKYGTAYNVIYWPDFGAWSFHFVGPNAKGHSADRLWYDTKEAVIARIEAM